MTEQESSSDTFDCNTQTFNDLTNRLDAILQSLLQPCESQETKPLRKGSLTPHVNLDERDIYFVCRSVKKIFKRESSLLDIHAPIKIFGDIHGQFDDLLQWFKIVGLPPDESFLFLGDYVDRGRQSIEVISLLLALKVKYPERVFLLRGNHECHELNRNYGFYDECKRRYSIKLFKIFTDVFNRLPVAAVIENRIFCVHGGLSPELKYVSQINSIVRPTLIPHQGLLCDLLWSDPAQSAEITGWTFNKHRQVSYIFGADVIEAFIFRNNLDLICRSHEVVEMGYQFYANKRLVTIFSAPRYCRVMHNKAAIMNVDPNLVCSFTTYVSDDTEPFSSDTDLVMPSYSSDSIFLDNSQDPDYEIYNIDDDFDDEKDNRGNKEEMTENIVK